MQRLYHVVSATVVACLLCGPQSAAGATITFETVPLFTPDPLVVSTADGSVTFASTGNFFVATSFFSTLTGQVFLDADPIIAPLVLDFSTLVASVSLNFAMDSPSSSTLFTLAASLGGVPVATLMVTGAVPPGFTFVEGFASFAPPGGFNRLTLSTTAPNFAIDNVNFTPVAVPEPATLVVFGAGAAALFRRARRRR